MSSYLVCKVSNAFQVHRLVEEMGSICCRYREELDCTADFSTDPTDKIFKSDRFCAAINENTTDVVQGKKTYIDKEREWGIEIISRQVTAINREDMKKCLTRWEEELRLNSSDYDDFNELTQVAENNPDWPKHLKDRDRNTWESMQRNNGRTNWLYFNVRRINTDSDTPMFDLAICHLISTYAGIPLNVLIGGLIEKGLLCKDGRMKFQQESDT